MTGRITDRSIQEVRDRIDIVDLISEYVKLKKSGRSFTGLCPFHSEKTPSFTADRSKGLFYCFGCQKGGDAFAFLMEIEKIAFNEAAERLAERGGIELEREASSERSREDRSKRERLFSLSALAVRYYKYVLKETATGKAAREYLKKRGIEEQTICDFYLGFSPPGWSHFTEFAKKKGFSDDELISSGVAIKGKKGLYDRFRARIIFPIQEASGKVVAFGGRIIDSSTPKYLNSPENPIYTKGNNLYGLNQAKEAIRREGLAIICEGYTDLIWMHQSGVENSVASLGTALTEKQLRLISKFTDKVVLVFDSDAAGQMAAERGFELGNATETDVLVAELPSGQDPADFISRNSSEDFLKIVDDAVPVVEFRLKKIIGSHDLSKPGQRDKVLNESTEILCRLDSPVIREDYLNRLFDLLNLSEEGVAHVKEKMKRLARRSSADERFSSGVLKSLNEIERIERRLLSVIVNGEAKDCAGLERLLEADDFNLPIHKDVFRAISEGKDSSRKKIRNAEDSLQNYITGLVIEGSEASSNFEHLIFRLKESRLLKEAKALSKKVDEANENEKQELMKKLRGIEDKRKEMRLKIGKMIENATLGESEL